MAVDARSALVQVEAEPPDLILLEVNLPDMDGLAVLRQIGTRVPVIFVTARRQELDEVLELGAEDYITKPFAKDVPLAQVRTVLRRNQQNAPPAALVVGDLVIDLDTHIVTLGGRPISLAPLEFRLLHALAQWPNQVIASEELLRQVWGEEYVGEPQIIYVYMRSLRTKLETDPQRPRIVTMRGVGYKLVPQDSHSAAKNLQDSNIQPRDQGGEVSGGASSDSWH